MGLRFIRFVEFVGFFGFNFHLLPGRRSRNNGYQSIRLLGGGLSGYQGIRFRNSVVFTFPDVLVL